MSHKLPFRGHPSSIFDRTIIIVGTSCLHCWDDVVVKIIRRYFQRHAFVATINNTYLYYEIDIIKIYTNVYLMVLVQNKYKNTLVGVLRTLTTFITHSSPSCYVTLRTQAIRLNSGNLGPQKTDSGIFIIAYPYTHVAILLAIVCCLLTFQWYQVLILSISAEIQLERVMVAPSL